jgi:catechol 2,3-dioxygenase-like lactoylglutathione lyase family enzyme
MTIDPIQTRFARPTDRLDEVVAFYRDGVGLPVIGSFEDHDGYDGVMLGLPGRQHHLELTSHRDGSPCPAPSRDNLLVLYLPDPAALAEARGRLERLGHEEVAPENPYWADKSVTFEDPDGWRVVLCATHGLVPAATSEPRGFVEPYRARAIRFLDRWNIASWRLKVYGIAYRGESPRPELVAAARRLAEERLAHDADGTSHYGVGFVGVHEGRGGNFVFVDWWADENELHHHVYVAEGADSTAFRYRTPTGLAACAWDLRVIGFERDAWVEHVLRRVPEPDFEAYLAARLEADV